jgi:Tol biopolymer transport system component
VKENVDVWRLPLDAETGLASGEIEPVIDNAGADRLVNLSDNGGTMAFISSRTGQEGVWIRDVQGGGERQVSRQGSSARISRDGSTLAVTKCCPATEGTDLVSLTDGLRSRLCDDCGPGDWSPDSARLILVKNRPSRLFVRDLGSGRESELAAHREWSLLQPRFSDDGQWIVFHTANAPTLRQVWAFPASSDRSIPVEAWIRSSPIPACCRAGRETAPASITFR